MKTKYLLMALAAAALLALSACSAGSPAPIATEAATETAAEAATEAATAAPEVGEFPSGEGCDQGPEGTIPLINQDHGYCLRYPEGFEESYPTADETVLNNTHVQVFILVSPVEGKTAREIADGIVAEAKPINPDVQSSDITFAGEPAVLLEGVPGQDLSRQVIAVHGERAYRLTFVPWDPASESFDQLESLYNTILGSFEFH